MSHWPSEGLNGSKHSLQALFYYTLHPRILFLRHKFAAKLNECWHDSQIVLSGLAYFSQLRIPWTHRPPLSTKSVLFEFYLMRSWYIHHQSTSRDSPSSRSGRMNRQLDSCLCCRFYKSCLTALGSMVRKTKSRMSRGQWLGLACILGKRQCTIVADCACLFGGI